MRERLSCLRPERWSLFIAATAWVFCASCPSPLMAVTLPGVTWSAIYGFTGGSYSDESANGNALSTLSGSPGFVAGRNGLALQGSSGALLGRAVGLTGFNPTSGQLTLSAWIKTTSSGNEIIASMGRSSLQFDGEWIWGISGGQLYFWDYQGGYGFPSTFMSTATANNGQWRHVAFVRTGLAGNFYVDGIPAGSTTAAKSVSYANSTLVLGGDYRDSASYWTGQMDEVSISSSALTAAQISSLANDALVPGVETGPTNSISGLTQTTVKLMGGITNLGGTTVTNAGFYLNTNSPATNGVKYSAPGTSFGTGTFSNTITNLVPGTSYYYRAFAANSIGVGYGVNEYSFTTLSASPTTKVTPTVSIGGSTSFTFNSTMQGPGVSDVNKGGSTGGVTLQYGGASSDGKLYGPTNLPPVNAGNYTLVATVAEDATYAQGTASVNFSIGKAAATVTVANTDQTYDGATKQVIVTTDPDSLLVEVLYNGAAAAPTNAGSYSVMATVNDPNYAGAASGAILKIAKGTPVLSGISASGIKEGQTLSASTLTGMAKNAAGADVPGVWSFRDPSQTPSAGVKNQGLTFTPTDTMNYNTVDGSVAVNVAPSDSDGDGLSDAEESRLGTNPLIVDTDGDTLLDGAEVALGTSPTIPDTDGDKVPDGVEVTNGTDPLNSASNPLPVITQQPAGGAKAVGTNWTLSVNATDPTGTFLVYQWKKNGVNLGGATFDNFLTISSLKFSDAGEYEVLVSNPLGSTSSSVATLVVQPPLNHAPVLAGQVATYDAVAEFISGPLPQSTDSRWQYFGGNESALTLLGNWKTTGNEIIQNQPQWDGGAGYLNNYPFVQRVNAVTGPFPAGCLVVHPSNLGAASRVVAVGWKNSTSRAVLANFQVNLRLPYSWGNGIEYRIQRGLTGSSRHLLIRSGTLGAGESASLVGDALVEMQAGEMLYLTIDSKDDFAWDQTEVSAFTVSVFGATNLSPILGNTAPAGNPGTAVPVLLEGATDADSGALKGIAVTGVDTTHGSWEYTVDGGNGWYSLSEVGIGSARLLKSDALHRVRFLPNANFYGNAEIRYRAWDQTSGSDGALADLTSIGGGAWVLVAYGAQASLGGSLTMDSGSFSSLARTGSAVLPSSLGILKNGMELAMTWTTSGGSFPIGGIDSYTHGIAFALPNAAGASFDGSASSPLIYNNGANPLNSSFAVGSSNPDQSLVNVRTLVGSPGMPAQMYLRNKTFGAGYGSVYGVVMNDGSNPQLDYNQVPDGQTFKAVYLDHGTGAAQGQGLVMGGSGGAPNSYVPSTMALWARLDPLQVLMLSGGNPVSTSGNYLLNGISTTYVDVINFDASGAFSAETATGTIHVATNIPATIALSPAAGSYTLLQGAVPLDDGLTVSGGGTFSGATIQIETGFALGDTLSLTPSVGGITGSYDGTKGILTLSGSGSASEYQAALRAVTFSTTSTSTASRGFKVTLGSAISFGGHYYEFVPGSYTWAEARTAALGKTFNGMSGYLANLTSADENSFVKTKIGTDVWIGGSDEGTEGAWKWMDGPEAGINFWNGLSGGSAPSGRYANWNSGEPNNAGNEDYAQFYVTTGKWNDLPSGSRLGFLVEYGTDISAIQTFSGTRIFSVTKAVPTISVAPLSAQIAFGQTLAFSTLIGGVSSVEGSFAWADSAVAPARGTSIQNVIFTPKDRANYSEVTVPVNVTVNPSMISSGFSHSLYLATGSSNVMAWGLNTDGRLGVGDTNSPVNWARAVQGIPSGATIDALSAGGAHSLILASQKVYAAGADRFGQLGQGGVNGATKASFTPVVLTEDTPVAIAAGANHSLIVTASGKVFACGDNTYGQLARSSTTASSGALAEVSFPGLTSRIVSVAAGADHNLALDQNGGVWVWGRNDSGQLGKNSRTLADRTPALIMASGGKTVAAGFAHSLVLKQDGTVLGFGRNTLGQAGQSSSASYVKAPTVISVLSGVRSIAAGTDSSFAITESGQLYSWGYNSYGELLLGYSSPISAPAVYGPTPSPICTNVYDVSGGGYSSLAVGAQGVIFAGRNDMGQSGNGPDPAQVVGDYAYETGDLALTNLTMDLAGTAETLYDQIFVGNGTVTLNGIVNLMFVGTYTGPMYGSAQTFDLIWAKNGIVLGGGYQTAFIQSGYLVESVVADKNGGKVLQATVRAVVTAADVAKAASLASPSLDGVESVGYTSASGMGISVLSASPGVEMIYSYERPTGGVSTGAQYFVNGITYRVEQVSSLAGAWADASLSGTTVTPLGNGRERVTLRISSSGATGFLRLQVENPQATGISAGVGSAVTY